MTIWKKIQTIAKYPEYKKKIIKYQKSYDDMVIACAKDQNSIIVGERPELISFIDAAKLVIKGKNDTRKT